MEQILRANPHLKLYNYADISDRLLEVTNNNMFVVYNGFNGRFEVHSSLSYKLDKGNSLQVSFEDTSLLNDWLIRDVQANDHKKFRAEIEGTRQYLERVHDNAEENRSKQYTDSALKAIETVLGRRL